MLIKLWLLTLLLLTSCNAWKMDAGLKKCKEGKGVPDKREMYLQVEGMEEANRLEIDNREDKDIIYVIGGNRVMKTDMEWTPMWVVDVEEQVDGIAMVPRNEVTMVMGEKMVRVKNEGEVGGGFVVEGQKERIVAISKNSDSLVDEVVVIYENGYLCKIHIIERKVKCFLIGTFNFIDIVYSIKLDQKDRPVYIGIATSSFVGLIDIENQNNNHLFTSGECHTTYTSSGVNCIHGGISFNHKYQDEYAFYYNNAKGIFVIGYIFIESKYIKSIKAIAFTIDIISSNIDKNYKIYSFGLNKIFLISSDTLIFIRDFKESQATTLKINKNAIIKSNIINVSIYI